MFSQMVVVLVVPFILPESSRWLMTKGREEKLLKIMRRIAYMNNREVKLSFVQATFVLATLVHIRNISAVTDPILIKL